MRVALVFYGFFRTFDFCKTSLQEHVLDIINPDIYINSPDTIYAPPDDEIPELHNMNSRSLEQTNSRINFFSTDKLQACHLRQYKSAYYKQYVAARRMITKTSVNQYSWRVLSAIHSISLAIQSFKTHSRKHHLEYDLVILTRPDLRYYRYFDLSNIRLDCINYPSHHMCDPCHPTMDPIPFVQRNSIEPRIRHGAAKVFGTNHNFNDQIICGSPDNIIELGKVFGMIPQYYKENILLNTETYLGMQCLKNSIELHASDLATYEIWRLNQAEY